MKRFSNMLLIWDGEAEHSSGINRAVTLARNNQATLTLCAVIDVIPSELRMASTVITPVELTEIAVAKKREVLEKAIESIGDESVSIQAKVLVGKPFIEITRQVLSNHYDLVIKCAEEPSGAGEILFGSTDMHLMRKCPCPVWILKPTIQPRYRRIMAAVDQPPEGEVSDDLNSQILELATSLAMSENSELHVVHAWQLYGESFLRSQRSGYSDADVDALLEEESKKRQQWLENLVLTYGRKEDKDAVNYLAPQLHIIKGNAKHVVPIKAQSLDVDLMVMGTVARTGIKGFFMGNTAESILSQLDSSVLTVKPGKFISPITLDK